VPVLIQLLDHKSEMVQTTASEALGHFGGGAKDAFPALLKLVDYPDLRIAEGARNALIKIDREAARNAGVK
jgi:HEAT repeat protein